MWNAPLLVTLLDRGFQLNCSAFSGQVAELVLFVPSGVILQDLTGELQPLLYIALSEGEEQP